MSDDGAGRERELAGLYDSLARYQVWRRRLGGARAGERLEMHKRLLSPPGDGPPAGCAGLNDWLWSRLDPPPVVRVLDVGCGLGGTLQSWARRAPEGTFVGLSTSAVQVRAARREAERAGVAERCEFRLQSFDDSIEGRFDVVVSVESLFHAPDLARSVRHLAERLAPLGSLVAVEDLARDASVRGDGDARELLERWSTARLSTADEFRQCLEAAGLELDLDVDLTAQVPRRSVAEVDVRRARLARLRRLAPLSGVRRIVDAFLGGLALERLYDRGLMEYRALRARRGGGLA